MNEDHVAALEWLFGRLKRDELEGITDDINEICSVERALAWALPILRASTAPVVIDAEFIEDDEGLLADAQRRLQKRRLDAGLDAATGRPLQVPIADSGRTGAGTVPSATNGLLMLVKDAAAGKARLDPGEGPKKEES